MSKQTVFKLTSATLAASLATYSLAHATENPFQIHALGRGYMVAEAPAATSTGDDANSAGKREEGKYGEGEDGDGKKATAPAKDKEGKCGEGKCGAGKGANKPKPETSRH